ncbi:hypothetical protein RRG08_043683 [Elysia crispata]|uniref:Uncharacterized protein n=1 Tax=Elysia crispata TaxID=231223 RepID=A0AAE0ZVC0_9GAST|nr:hypothetical protein RRG08_043683 [Elysia crispata]
MKIEASIRQCIPWYRKTGNQDGENIFSSQETSLPVQDNKTPEHPYRKSVAPLGSKKRLPVQKMREFLHFPRSIVSSWPAQFRTSGEEFPVAWRWRMRLSGAVTLDSSGRTGSQVTPRDT